MFRFLIAALCVSCCSAAAEDNPASQFLQCYKIQDSDTERLDCYDGLSREMQVLASRLRRANPSTSTPCDVDDWTISRSKLLASVSGATTCETGSLTYRFYDAENDRFLMSGSTRINGFTFNFAVKPGDLTESVTMKYVIE